MTVQCMHLSQSFKSKLFIYFMPPSDYLYIFSFGYSVLIPSVLFTLSLPEATFVAC